MSEIFPSETRRLLGVVEQALEERDFALADEVLRSACARPDFRDAIHVVRQVRQQAYGRFERSIREDYFAGDEMGFYAWTSSFGRRLKAAAEAGRSLDGLVPDPPGPARYEALSLWETWELLIARGWAVDREPGFFEGVATAAAYALEAAGR